MEQNREPEIDPNKYIQLIFDSKKKKAKTIKCRNKVFLTNGITDI